MAVSPNIADPTQGMVTLRPLNDQTFVIETEESFGSEDEMASFELDATGKVSRMYMGNVYADAVDSW